MQPRASGAEVTHRAMKVGLPSSKAVGVELAPITEVAMRVEPPPRTEESIVPPQWAWKAGLLSW